MYEEETDEDEHEDEPGQHRRRRIANKKASTPTPELQDDQMGPLQDSDDEDDVMEEPPRSSPRLHPGRGQARRADNVRRAESRDKACDVLEDMEAKLKRQEKLEQAAAKRRAQTVLEEEEYKKRYPYKTGDAERDRRMLARQGQNDLMSAYVEIGLYTEAEAATVMDEYDSEMTNEEGNLSWADIDEGTYLYSFYTNEIYHIQDQEAAMKYLQKYDEAGLDINEVYMRREREADQSDRDANCQDEEEYEGFRVVTENVPGKFTDALYHPVWGGPLKTEIGLLKDKVIVKISYPEAMEYKKNGADIVRLFHIYEIKTKDGVDIYKVRLVADGRTHRPDGPTYAATPSREELLILLHIIAREDWEFAHVDESRAFTGALHTDSKVVLAKITGDVDFYKVINALYGLKTAPLDYKKKAAKRLTVMGFKRKAMSTNLYIRRRHGGTSEDHHRVSSSSD
jgi:hypothetical protein